jgi:hypothetical protein
MVPLDFPAAEGAGNSPAHPAGVLAAIQSIVGALRGRRTNSEIMTFAAAYLSAAFFDFPAILFHFPLLLSKHLQVIIARIMPVNLVYIFKRVFFLSLIIHKIE